MEDYPQLYEFVNEYQITMSNYQKKYYDIYEEYIQTSQVNVDHLENNDGCYETFLGRYLLYSNREDSDSIKFFEMAITKGNIEAMFEMGWYLEDLKYSFDEAIKYYKMVIKHEPNSENKNTIADSFTRLGKTVPDVEEGVEFYKKAHEMGHPTASYYLGEHYMTRKYRNEEQMEYYMSHILKDVNNDFYNHAIGNMIVFYEYNKKDFNKVIDLAYLDWLKYKGTSPYDRIDKYLKKVIDLNKVLEISVKINDFKDFCSREITEHFMKFENIDYIFHHLKVVPLDKHLIKKFYNRYFEKYSMIINAHFKQAEKLPDELVKKIILFK